MLQQSRLLAADVLPETKRMERICKLLAKAVLLDAASRIISPEPQDPRAPKSFPISVSTQNKADAARIEAYLALVGAVSPSTIQTSLGLSRMRVYRAAQRLVSSGRLTVTGRTRAVIYRLGLESVRREGNRVGRRPLEGDG